ncbi:hypothetical protein LSAT2_016975 [Lamellibrachia satsuma]|nr:hypothetical protein LSAT2_016975 [Lamellibrachia satsuma]
MTSDKGQVSRLFSSPVSSKEREAHMDSDEVNNMSMHIQELPMEKCDTANKTEENGIDEASDEDGEVRRRSSSVLEAKERAHNFLRDELQKAQQELKLKDKECQKLHQVQEKMGGRVGRTDGQSL